MFASYKECTMFREINIWIDDFTPCLKDNLTGEVRIQKLFVYTARVSSTNSTERTAGM